MKQEKIKLLFQRNYGTLTGLGQGYRLTQIENAVTAPRPTNNDVFRVGDVVNEKVVQEFVESRRDFSVKVKS